RLRRRPAPRRAARAGGLLDSRAGRREAHPPSWRFPDADYSRAHAACVGAERQRRPREGPMSKRNRGLPVAGRAHLLQAATPVGAAALTPTLAAEAQGAAPRPDLKAALPGPQLTAAETMPPAHDPVTQTSSGGEFMVDVLKTLDIDYLAMNCASSFRGLHEA